MHKVWYSTKKYWTCKKAEKYAKILQNGSKFDKNYKVTDARSQMTAKRKKCEGDYTRTYHEP